MGKKKKKHNIKINGIEDSTKEINTLLKIEETDNNKSKMNKNNTLLKFIFKNATSFGSLFAIGAVIVPAFFNIINSFIRQGYNEYLGLNNVVVKIGFGSFWESIALGVVIALFIYIDYVVIKLNKKQIYSMLLLCICILSEIILLLSFIEGFMYDSKGIIYLPLIIFICTLLFYYIFVKYIIKHTHKTQCIYLVAIVLLYLISLFFIKSASMLIALIVTFFIFFPFLLDYLDEKPRQHIFSGLCKTKANNDIISLISLIVITALLFITFVVSIYNNITGIESFKKQGSDIVKNETVHQIIEESGTNNKYLLLETENQEKIIMKIINPDVKKDKDKLKTYFVSKGEFSYLTEYNRLTIKTEKCYIDVKENKDSE